MSKKRWHRLNAAPPPAKRGTNGTNTKGTEWARRRPAHTPGPWIVEDGCIEAPGINSTREAGCSGRMIGSVLTGCSPGIDRVGSKAEQRANARLIAAAPDLLAACKAALELFERHGPVLGDSDSAHTERQMRALVRAAVTKADV